jgi:metal-sulfur cluster biosynthetic enzyme
MTTNSIPAIDNTVESTVQSALRDCFDPALPCNIVDLGLVENATCSCDTAESSYWSTNHARLRAQ